MPTNAGPEYMNAAAFFGCAANAAKRPKFSVARLSLTASVDFNAAFGNAASALTSDAVSSGNGGVAFVAPDGSGVRSGSGASFILFVGEMIRSIGFVESSRAQEAEVRRSNVDRVLVRFAFADWRLVAVAVKVGKRREKRHRSGILLVVW